MTPGAVLAVALWALFAAAVLLAAARDLWRASRERRRPVEPASNPARDEFMFGVLISMDPWPVPCERRREGWGP